MFIYIKHFKHFFNFLDSRILQNQKCLNKKRSTYQRLLAIELEREACTMYMHLFFCKATSCFPKIIERLKKIRNLMYYVKQCTVYFLLLEHKKYLRNRKWFRQTTQTTVSIYISHIKKLHCLSSRKL